ncbi:hypothetical protein V6N13_063893 [Hibiscus sabdariffa]
MPANQFFGSTMEKSSESIDQLDDSNHPTDKLGESSHGSDEFGLDTRDCEHNVNEEDDLSEEINNDDDDDDNDGYDYDETYEFLLEEAEEDDCDWECDHQAEIDDWNRDYYNNSRLFEGDYRCLPLSACKKKHLDVGNKIIMPANALQPILENQIPMPLQFQIRNLSTGKVSHCGVFEFSGHEDDAVFMPDWMMENMQIQVGNYMYMKNEKLENATYIKLQPHSSDFIEISDPKAVLQENLRKFSCLTKGDTIMIRHRSRVFYINIVETGPADAVSLIDTDCEVDFAPPLDYEEHANPTPIESSLKEKQEEEAMEEPEFKILTSLDRKFDEEPCADSGYLSNKQSFTIQYEEEAAEKLKFKPFTGLARKLGENPYSELGSLSNKQLFTVQFETKESEEPKFKSLVYPARKMVDNPFSDVGFLSNKKLSITHPNEEETEKPKFKPFLGLSRKLGENPRSDLGSLTNKHLSVTVTNQSDLKKEQEDKTIQKPKFKPFIGLSKKLGENPRSDLGSLTNKHQPI